MVSDAVIKTKKKAPPGLGDLIGLYELSNQAEGKSPKTTSWYTEMLQAYST